MIEANVLGNIGIAQLFQGEYEMAIEYFTQLIQIADEISFLSAQQSGHNAMAEIYLYKNDLDSALATIETALGYDVPQNNHNVSTLQGIIALRQGDKTTAPQAFARAIRQADEILSKTAEYYSALDAKGLAICGLVICDLRLAGRGAVPAPDDGSKIGQGPPAPTVNDAIETFKKARKIAPHAGVVKSVLRLFDEMAKCDPEGLLEGVREAVEGKAENND